jgi:DNA-binding transcriptional ArsR family regulator
VACVRGRLLDDKTAGDLAQFFRALGDPMRVRIVHALAQEDLCVRELAALLPVGASAVSNQLRYLRTLRLVVHQREGHLVRYSLADDHVDHLVRDGLEHVPESCEP